MNVLENQFSINSRLLAVSAGLAFFLLIHGVAVQAQGGRADIEAVQKQFEACTLKGDAAGLAMLHTEDAQLFYPHLKVIRGRKAVEAAYKKDVEAIRSGKIKVKVSDIEIEVHGDTAYRIGRYVESSSDGKVLDEGVFWWILKREDGEWKIHRDIFNSTLPKNEKTAQKEEKKK